MAEVKYKKSFMRDDFGFGNLNDASLAALKDMKEDMEGMRITNIPFANIYPNPKNEGMSMNNIEELAMSIKDVGLQSPIIVKEVNLEKYYILSGHRRFAAIKWLRGNGEELYDRVPCIIMNTKSARVAISEGLWEDYMIATANSEQRELTPSDKMKLYTMLNVVYDELKKTGVDVGKRRNYIANELNISLGETSRMDYIDNNLTDLAKEKISGSNLSINSINELAHLPAKKQNELAQQDELTQEDVQKAVEEAARKKEQANKKAEQRKKQNVPTDFSPAAVLAEIDNLVSELKVAPEYSPKETEEIYATYCSAVKALKKLKKIL